MFNDQTDVSEFTREHIKNFCKDVIWILGMCPGRIPWASETYWTHKRGHRYGVLRWKGTSLSKKAMKGKDNEESACTSTVNAESSIHMTHAVREWGWKGRLQLNLAQFIVVKGGGFNSPGIQPLPFVSRHFKNFKGRKGQSPQEATVS